MELNKDLKSQLKNLEDLLEKEHSENQSLKVDKKEANKQLESHKREAEEAKC